MKTKLTFWSSMLFLLSLSILLTIYLAWIFYPLEIQWLNLTDRVYLKPETIQYNFHILMNYLTNPFSQDLQMPDFRSSASGLHHFAVVKNLFLRDDKKRNYYLVVMPEDKPANLKALRVALEARPLRFASEEDLHGILGLRGGAVSPFGVLNDEEGKVQVVFDEALRDWPAVGVHPNDNTATLRVPLSDLLALFQDRAVPYRFVDMDVAPAQ